MNAQEQTITFDDGASTVLERWGDAGPNLLCVHGMMSSRRGWARFATRFALAYRVWAYDQRGHGDAAAVDGPMTLAQSVADLQTVCDAIPGPIDALAGHSWGGAVVILAGLRVPARTVIAIDPLIHQPAGDWEKDYVNDQRPIFEKTGADREAEILASFTDADELDVAGKIHAMRTMRLETIERIGRENGVDEGKWDLREQLVNYPLPLFIALADPAETIVAALPGVLSVTAVLTAERPGPQAKPAPARPAAASPARCSPARPPPSPASRPAPA